MCTTTKNREINYYKSIEDFIPYFYSKTIKGKLPNIMSHEELLTWYHTDPDAKLWLDKEFEIAKEQFSVSQSNKAFKIYTDPALEESKLKVFEALQRGRDGGCSQRGGLTNVETGHIKALGEIWGAINFRKMAKDQFTCSVCGYTGLGRANKKRWHEDNCALPIVMDAYSILPQHFTRKMARTILEENKMKPGLADKILHDPTYSWLTVKSHEGTKDSPSDLPIWSKSHESVENNNDLTIEEIKKENAEFMIRSSKKTYNKKENKRTCKFCKKTMHVSNYLKSGHDKGKCMIKKKSKRQITKETDIKIILEFFKDKDWFRVKDYNDFCKSKLTHSRGPAYLEARLKEIEGFINDTSRLMDSPAGPRYYNVWKYTK